MNNHYKIHTVFKKLDCCYIFK